MRFAAAQACRWLSLAGAGIVASVLPAGAQFVEPDANVLYTIVPAIPGAGFGFVGEGIGDVTGDGVPDFIIGATRDPEGGTLAGAAFIYSGADGTLVHKVVGAPFNRIGFSVAGLGDVDLDGTPDYATGGPGTLSGGFPQFGRVLVLSGADHSVIRDIAGTIHGGFFGYDINRAGDVNGDGRPDLIVGSPFASTEKQFDGRIDLVSAWDGAFLWNVHGQDKNTFLGAGVSGIGDRNGDGVPEQGAGAPGAGPKGVGQTFVLDGVDGTLLDTLKPANSAGGMGYFFVHDAGDVDADGIDDTYVGDFSDEVGGRAYVFSGADGRRLLTVKADDPGDGLGIGRGIGDVDGDGHADLIVAGYTDSEGAPQGGKMLVVSGGTAKVIRTMTGNVAGALLGFDALAIGDVNGDGKTDFLITGVDVAHVVAGN